MYAGQNAQSGISAHPAVQYVAPGEQLIPVAQSVSESPSITMGSFTLGRERK